MLDAAYLLRRIPLPRTLVNKGKESAGAWGHSSVDLAHPRRGWSGIMSRMEDLGARIVAAFRDAIANKTLRVATALGLAVTVAVAYGFWLNWEWKAMIGWRALEGYIDPDPGDTTGNTVPLY
jgi:hypothetical protein